MCATDGPRKMAEKHLLSYDLETKTRIDFHYDDGRVTLHTTQDCEGIVDYAKRLNAMGPSRAEIRPKWTIPNTLALKWIAEEGWTARQFFLKRPREQNAFFRRKMQSNEYRDLWLTPQKGQRYV